jgi:hypothetical protein
MAVDLGNGDRRPTNTTADTRQRWALVIFDWIETWCKPAPDAALTAGMLSPDDYARPPSLHDKPHAQPVRRTGGSSNPDGPRGTSR